MRGLTLEQGGEYEGETYILCFSHGKPIFFEGTNLDELMQFLHVHEACES